MLLEAAALMGGLGLALGLAIGFASKLFHVEPDPRAERVLAALPGANCGGCGFPGCAAFAEAVVSGKGKADGCVAGGSAVASKVGEVMGQKVEAQEPRTAVLRCAGSSGVCGLSCEYQGVETCAAATLLASGPKRCTFGCLAMGDCVRACRFSALDLGEVGLPAVDEARCVACGACVKACPKGLILLAPKKARVHVLCQSHDPGKVVAKVCKVGCIACRMCEKACTVGAVRVDDELASIDYAKCTNCGACAEKCPRKCIKDRRPEAEREASRREREGKAAGGKAGKERATKGGEGMGEGAEKGAGEMGGKAASPGGADAAVAKGKDGLKASAPPEAPAKA
jgi:electron transport complex protein RnfB